MKKDLINRNIDIKVNDMSFKMIYVEGGTFWMGAQHFDPLTFNYDPKAYNFESPVHQVSLDSYYIGEFEVTQELWINVMNNNPSYFKNNQQRPVEMVNYLNIQDFITKLKSMTGKLFALPTEAQWEYAARGGIERQYRHKYSGSDILDDVAWYNANSDRQTHPVGQKQPNELGIYDMNGNVWEWCNDIYEEYKSDPQENPEGAFQGSYRVIRGGAYTGTKVNNRITNRLNSDVLYENDNLGFRLVMNL